RRRVVAQRLAPLLGYEDAAAAIDVLSAAFRATQKAEQRATDEHGTVFHAELALEGSTIFLSTPEGYVSSRTHRAGCETERRMHDNPWVIDGLFVEGADLEATFPQAA